MKRKDLKPGTVFKTADGATYIAWDGDSLDLTKSSGWAAFTAEHVHPNHRKHSGSGMYAWNAETEVEVIAEPWTVPAEPPLPILTTDKKARKEMPIARGVVDYFPRALAAVARVSFVANEQHNPGQPMHWDKSKSTDHADCIARHLIERGGQDDDGLLHSAKLAWRALALLETELENESKK